MRILFALLTGLFIIACNNSAKKKDTIKDTAKEVIQMPETPVVPDTIFTGLGTEPFWSVYVINNNKIIFHPADGPDMSFPFVAAINVNNTTTKYISTTGNASIELIILKKDCNDGMSEQTYPYQVSLVVNKTKYAGCGRND